jgi:hypothetical protein
MFSAAAVIAAATIFGLTYSLSASLIGLDLDARGYSETFIGLNAGMHACGVLLIAPFMPWLAARVGARQLTLWALMLSAVGARALCARAFGVLVVSAATGARRGRRGAVRDDRDLDQRTEQRRDARPQHGRLHRRPVAGHGVRTECAVVDRHQRQRVFRGSGDRRESVRADHPAVGEGDSGPDGEKAAP